VVKRKDIEKLIIQNKKSNLKNHWNDAFSKNAIKYSGEIRPHEILLWRSSLFLRGAYPIFHFTFDQDENMNGIRTEKNPYHIVLTRISIVLPVVFIAALFIFMNLELAIIASSGILILSFLLHLVLNKSRKFETNLIQNELKETIGNIERQNNPHLKNVTKTSLNQQKIKEWTLTKILTRLLVYPFCGFITWLSLTGFLPEGKIILGIFGIVVGLGYPIVDLIILFKRKTPTF